MVYIFKKIGFLLEPIMAETPSTEVNHITEDMRNLSTLKKDQNYSAIKDLKNLFQLEKETKAINTQRYQKSVWAWKKRRKLL